MHTHTYFHAGEGRFDAQRIHNDAQTLVGTGLSAHMLLVSGVWLTVHHNLKST